ncbi:MAG: alpha-amylase family glycosyl hydrolase [Pyrinomonadaceae bacterium MAG19_C2-C3]|nr:alpha-amylase family glycosyl hydrolase [Pyrinomonadaceae bacterium MAG19_C2-C3]
MQKQIINSLRSKTAFCLIMLLLSLNLHGATFAQNASRDYSKEQAQATRSPAWVREGVVYEIFPRAFSAQGNFNGITARLDELKSAGVTILWLMPIHPIGQEKKKGTIGSPYAVRDFYGVNADYGTKEDLRRLVREAHQRGMKVIIDIVANHTSWDSVMMRTPEFYTRDVSGKIIPPVPDWADVADLNYENPALRKYMTEMLKSWIRDYDLDGFRCDVAGMVPTAFWESLRLELEAVKKDIVMLAEWNTPELLVKAFDLDYSWGLLSALNEVGMNGKPASVLRTAWEEERAKYPKGSLHMRFSDNHDERRAIARFGEKGALAASVLMFTLDGVPMLYNGMEAGDTTESGAPALFERLPVFWQMRERRPEFPRLYKSLIEMRKQHASLRSLNLEWVKNSEDARVISYLRRDASEEILVVVNFSNRPVASVVDAPMQNFVDVTPDISAPVPSDATANERAGRKAQSRVVMLPNVLLDAWEFRVFRRALR